MRDRPKGATAALILIADDNRDTREMYALHLSMLGYSVAVAADGREAVATARRLLPRLIVMDLLMPKLDGWAAIRELQARAETAAIPIVVLTGHDFGVDLKPAALAVGAASFLMKPCLPEQLAREISAGLAAPPDRAARGVAGLKA